MASHNALLTATQTNIGIDGSELTSDSALAKCSDIEAARVALARTLAPSVVFIDSAVDDIGTLIAGVQPNVRVFVLDSDTDGVEQIVAVLQAQPDVGEIHIVSHGEPGCLYLGNTRLSAGTIGHYTQAFSALKALSHVPPLLLYGCNLAAGDVGGEFLEKLHQITNLPIAASRTKVGDGGTWALDVTAGTLTRMPQLPFTQETRSSYTGAFANAQLVRDINPTGSSNPSGYNTTVIDGQLFFTADDGVTGRELWVSDGTEEGTQLVRDINPDNGNSNGYYYYAPAPYNFIEVGGQLFFTADDGTTGRELWVSDGTEEGTQLVQDINPDNGNSNGYYSTPVPYNFIEVGGQLFFTADDGTTGRELWVSDGTEEGTQLVRDINPNSNGDNGYYYYYAPAPTNFIEVGGQLFFTASDGATGRELWVSDGTEEGTQLVRDINPDNGNYPAPTNFIEVGGQLFFTADDGVIGRELWVSDGTEEGTQLVRDINPNNGNDGNGYYYYVPAPTNFIEVGGQLFFTASDGVTGRELWGSDGTEEGTQLVRDINPNSNDDNGYYYYAPAPYNFIEVGGQLFFTASDGATGRELWVSDGTEEGTRLVKDINPSSDNYPAPYNFTEVGGQLFFTADDGVNGRELWVSDGTEEGTQLVRDINPDNSNSNGYYYYSPAPRDLTAAGDLLFFTADDGIHGRELWISDGTTEGTQLFQDINPGNDGSFPDNFNIVDNQLFFTADDGTTGEELWVVSIPDNVVSGDDTDNVLNGTAGSDLINGLGGNDVIRARGGDDIVFGGEDDDVLFGNGGNDALNGGSGNDQIFGDRGDDTLQGGAGDDALNGGGGNDTVVVNDFSGNDIFDGGGGTDLIRFEPADGRDLRIFLDQGAVGDGRGGGQFFENFEQIATGRGNDRILGDTRSTLLDSGDGNDTILGGSGRDTLLGSNGQDELRGEQGRDELIGGTGRDTLLGGGGADTLIGGQGDDVLIGEGGADTFRFERDLLDGQADTDTIQTFQSQDILDFDDYLSAGGSITVTRVTSGLLRLDLSSEDIVNVFGNQSGLDAAEIQLASVLESLA